MSATTKLKGAHKKPLNQNQLPLYIMIDATEDCQLGCKYCYFGQKKPRAMDIHKILSATVNLSLALKEVSQHGVNFHYMGGEPTKVWDLIRELNGMASVEFFKLGISFSWSLTSNLVELDKEKAIHLKSENARVHCSIDGPEDIQDKNRPFRISNAGSFVQITKNIPHAINHASAKTGRATICPEDAHRLPEIVKAIFDFGFRQASVFPRYDVAWNKDDIKRWCEGLSKATSLTQAKYPGRRVSTIIKPFHSNAKEDGFRFCGGGKSLWSLNVDGMLYMCHHLSRDGELAIIDASTASPEQICAEITTKGQRPFSPMLFIRCKNCAALQFCNGGCWSNNLQANKSTYSPDTKSCELRHATAEMLLKDHAQCLIPRQTKGACIPFCNACDLSEHEDCVHVCEHDDDYHSSISPYFVPGQGERACWFCDGCNNCDTSCDYCDNSECGLCTGSCDGDDN